MTSLLPDVQNPLLNGLNPEAVISEFEEILDWRMLFGNANPVVIEIGCGKGRFIIQSAQQNPDTNFFGIEKSGKYYRILKHRVAKSGTTNIRLFWGEAAYFMEKHIPAGSVQAFHIYFPDPWPKKRHNKRRLVNTQFIESVKSSLVLNGRVFFATDFEDYFKYIIAAAGACNCLEEIHCNVISPSETDPEKAATNYERKYLLQGRKIYKAGYRKR